MSKVLLISENILKSETILNDNVGAEFIRPAIEASQDMYLQQLIGSQLIDKLYQLVIDDTIQDEKNGHYKTLIDDYITNYLKYKVLTEITLPLAYKYRSSGVVQMMGDHYQQSTLRDATLVQNHYEQRATFYGERLTRYLSANSNLFPEYMSTRDNADMMSDPDAYQTNILL